MEIYRMKDLIEVTGWSRKRLSQWLQQGIVVAEEPPKRAGCAAGFSLNNIIQFMVTDKLVNAGLALRTAAAISSDAVNFTSDPRFGIDPHTDEYLIVINLENHDEHYHLTGDPAEFNYGEWDVTLIVRLDKIFVEVAAKVEALSQQKI